MEKPISSNLPPLEEEGTFSKIDELFERSLKLSNNVGEEKEEVHENEPAYLQPQVAFSNKTNIDMLIEDPGSNSEEEDET